jgi:hypothetical protein
VPVVVVAVPSSLVVGGGSVSVAVSEVSPVGSVLLDVGGDVVDAVELAVADVDGAVVLAVIVALVMSVSVPSLLSPSSASSGQPKLVTTKRTQKPLNLTMAGIVPQSAPPGPCSLGVVEHEPIVVEVIVSSAWTRSRPR